METMRRLVVVVIVMVTGVAHAEDPWARGVPRDVQTKANALFAEANALFAQQAHATSSDYVYFSFVTMTTVGYGDLTAAGTLARGCAVLEALLGQVYLVTIVAVLVSNLGVRGRRDDAKPEQ